MKKPIYLAALLLLCACGSTPKPERQLLDAKAFETTLQGKSVTLVTLTNDNGMTAQITNYGARIVSLWVPDRNGTPQDVAWGYPSIDAYLDATDTYAGPVVGRYGNRIGQGRFTLDGTEYILPPNEGENQLHGGDTGFAHRVWTIDRTTPGSIQMTYLSPDGEEGYPGNLTLSVTYLLTPDNELLLQYRGTTDAPTVVNPTSHAYFNLYGTGDTPIGSHLLTIYADRFTPTDAALIPTGEIRDVEGTPMDFRTPTPIGERADRTDYEPIRLGSGYDHNYVLNKNGPDPYQKAAEVYEPSTGIVMEVWTDQPGIQFYGGNFMDGQDTDKYGKKHNHRTGFALETQNFPDAPNHAHFPNSVLRPGEVYTQTTAYKFTTR